MKASDDVEMHVAGLVLDPSSNAPIVILKDSTGELCLPIWIGLAEASAIASALKKIQVARPMTHDLLKTMIDELQGSVERIYIRALEESTFLASIELKIGEVSKLIDARPSDAIALAVRAGATIFVAPKVLEQAQVSVVPIATPSEDDGDETDGGGDDGVESNFANIEKDKWAEILAEMDPDDFKYKM